MRKLFRGKHIHTDQWLYGSLVDVSEKEKYIIQEKNYQNLDKKDICYPAALRVYADTVGEYTGLDDAHGNPIYDGDILKFGAYKVAVFWNGESYQWQARKQIEIWRKCPEKDWNYIELGQIAAEIPVCGQMTTEIVSNIYDEPGFYSRKKAIVDFGWE